MDIFLLRYTPNIKLKFAFRKYINIELFVWKESNAVLFARFALLKRLFRKS